MRHRHLAVIPGLLLACGFAAAQAPTLPTPPTATSITPGSATATTVAKVSGVTQVSTATVQNGNAYNQFTTFQIASGDTVDLLIPSAAANNNLLNLVSGSATQIYGTLNSRLSDGNIGGNVYFADPEGIVVGAGGVINVGSLTFATPSDSFVNNFFTDIADNTTALIAGTEPLTSNGLIAVLGQIHSAGPATLNATTVAVSGSITTGTAQFSGLVNTAGLQTGQAISINGDTITIDGGLFGGASPATLNSGSDDINLTANPSDSESIASAVASITLGAATLTGNNINVQATATSTSDDSLGNEIQNLTDLSTLPWQIVDSLAAWNTTSSTATINLGTGAGITTINATGNVKLAAEADSTTTIGSISPVVSFNYGVADATATADLGANAQVSAGGNVTLSALNKNTLAMTPNSVGASTPSVTVSYGLADSDSTTTLAGSVQAATVGVTADNENSFQVSAGDSAAKGGPAGVGVAIGSFSSSANATLSGSATASGADIINSDGSITPALNLAAISNNTTDQILSSSETTDDDTLTSVTNAATGGFTFLTELYSFVSKLGSSKVNSEDDNSSTLGLAAAVSYLSSSNAATTTESGSADASAGSAGITSSASDKPQSSAAGTAGDAKASIGGGVAIASFDNTANTTVSGLVTGDQGVNIAATATLPNPFSLTAFTSLPSEFDNFQFVAPSSITDTGAYEQDWNAAQTLGGDLVNIFNPSNSNNIGQYLNNNLGLFNLVTSFVQTGASGKASNNNSSFGLAGSVNILGITNQATATVANGADVIANNNGVNVTANSNAYLINLAGMVFDLGQLKDFNPGASGDASLGGTYNGFNFTDGATAAVDDGAQITADAGGAVNVNGTTNETLIDVAQAGDSAGKFGINGTFNWVTFDNTAEGYIQSNAVVDAGGAVNVNGTNTLDAYTIGGALGKGGSAEIGATVGWNQLTNTTLAYIGDPGDSRTGATGSVTAGSGGVNLDAGTNDTLWNVSLAAELATGQTQDTSGSGDTSEGGENGSEIGESGDSSSFGLGISGNVALNDITDTTQAFINNAANIFTPGAIDLTAQDTSFAVSGGLAFAFAKGGDGSGITLGGAFARNDFTKTTEAWVDNALLAGVLNPQTNLHDAAGSLDLSAQSTGSLLTISAGASLSTGESGVGIAGSANNNVLTNTTEAGLGSGANVDVAGTADISASQHDRVLAIAGALTYAGNVGFGAALDYSNYTNTTKAYVADNAALAAGGDISITASTDEQLLPIAAALGVSSDVGLGGTASKDEIQNDTEATIGDAIVNADGSLALGADDNSQLLLIVGSLGGAGDVGVGVSGAISTQSQPLFGRTVKSTIADGAQVSAKGSAPVSYEGQNYNGLLADATAEGGADTIVAGVGGAGDVGVAASLALNYFTEDVEATIANGAFINPGDAANNTAVGKQGVDVNASDDAQILDVAGDIAGSGAVSVGAAADVQFLDRTVTAEIGGTVNANNNIAVTASQGGSDWSIAAAGSFSGSVNIAGSASALFDTSKVTADIAPSAFVYTPASIGIAAQREENVNTIDGEIGISGDAGVGASVSLLEQNDTTTADVGSTATVTALGETPIAALVNVEGTAANSQIDGLAVTANANDTLLTIAAGGQASLGVSIAGSVVLNDISDTTDAYVDSGAAINPAGVPTGARQQAVDILANDSTNLTSAAGALAAGINIYGVGIGAAVNLEGPFDQLPSAASGFQSSLSSDLGGVSDNASSGVPAGFSKNTSAGVNNSAIVNAAGALDISALSSETLNDYDASVGAGIAGLAGSVELDDYTPTTTAYFGSCVSAATCSTGIGATANVGNANINANDTLNYFSVVGDLNAGGIGLGASVLDATVAADASAYVGANSSLTSSGGALVSSNFTDNYSSAVLAGGVGGIVANVPWASITDQSDNSAFVADNATVAANGGSASVNASTRRTISALSGAAIAGGLGVGATILDVAFDGSTAADLASGATISGSGGISVGAQLNDSVPEYLNLPSAVASVLSDIPGINGSQIPTGILGATAAGLAGIGGQVTVTDNASDTADIAAASLSGYGIDVNANDDPNLWAQSSAAEAGAIGGGASISDITLGGAVSATFDTNATATNAGLLVGSTLNETLNGDATGIGDGLATGNGTVVNINDTTSNTLSQSGSATATNSNVYLTATTTRNAYANAGSTNSGLLSVGISFADVNLDGSTAATLNGNVTANSSSGTAALQAADTDYAGVDAIVNAAGGFNGIGAMAGNPDGFSADPSRIDPKVTASVSSGASMNAATINVLANDSSTLNSTANGGGTGAVNVGLLDAEGAVAPNLTLNMDGSLSGGTITVQISGNQTVTSDAESPVSTSVLSLYSTSDGASSNPNVYLNFDGSASGTGNVTVESDSNNSVSATADAVQHTGPFGTITVLAGGLTSSNAEIDSYNVATAYGTIASSQGDAALNAVSVNNVTQNNATGGTGSGVAEGALTNATTKVYDTTHANLDATLDALAGTATVLASSTDNATSDAYMSSSGWSGIDYVQSNGYTGVDASPIVNVDGSANLQADTINISAELPGMISSASATAQAQKGFAGDGYANSDFEGIFEPTIEVHSGAQLTAPTINILAEAGTPSNPFSLFGASDPTAGTQSATGSAIADATNNATLFPGIKLDSGSTLTTNNLSVQALYPLAPIFGTSPQVSGVSTVTWVAEQVQEVVSEVVGWLPFGLGQDIENVVQTVTQWVEVITNSTTGANTFGTFNPGSAVTVDSTIQQLGASNGATLTIGADGQATTADGLSIQNEDNNNILVNGLVNTANPLQITLAATGGTVGGSPTILENDMPPFVNITNDSNLNLVLQQLSPIGGNGGNPPLKVTADTDALSPNFVDNQNPTAITIANNGSGDVLFTNVIADQPGSLSVDNLGGSILGTLNSQLDANQISLDAPHGSIGSLGSGFSCPICPGADANGDVTVGALNLQPDEESSLNGNAPILPQVSAVAVGDINLVLTPNEHVAPGVVGGAPSVNLTNILAGGDANITLSPANVQGVELVPVTINFFGTPLTFDLPEQVNGPAPNTIYNVGSGQWLAAGGNLNLNFGSGSGSQVTLNNNGLVASGFEGINFGLNPPGPSSLVTADNQVNGSLLDYLQSITGPPVLSNINASSGGHVALIGDGAVTGNGTVAVLDGESNVIINNLPAVQSIFDPGVNTSSITIFGNNEPLNGALAGSNVSVGSYGVNGGAIHLQSNTGLDLFGNLLAPLGVISVISQGDFNSVNGSINGGTFVTLNSSNGNLLLGVISAPSADLTATAAGSITDNGLITAVNATLNAKGGSMLLQQATFGNTVNLLAAQDLTAGAITAGGAASLNAQNGSILINQSLAAGGIAASAGQDITNHGTLLSLGDANLNAVNGNINGLGPISIGGNAVLNAGQSISLQTMTAGQSAALSAHAGDINLGTLTVSNGLASLIAGGNINADNGSISAATDANLNANGDINLGNLKAGGSAYLVAGGNIAAANGTIAAGADANLVAKNGDIVLGALSAGNDANLAAGDSIDAGTGILTAGNSATLAAVNDIFLGQLTAGQNASLTTANGDINLGAVNPGSVTAASGNATLSAGGNINAVNGSVAAGADANLTAAQNITLGRVTAAQDANLAATNGDINLGSVTATAGNATLTAGAGINAANGTVSAGNDATLTAADNIVLGDVTATAGNAQITAQNGFLNFGTITAGQDATLTAGQDINAITGAVTAGNNATLTAGGSINALGLVVNSGHNATLTAAAGSINAGNGSITDGNDANLTAAQNITLVTVLSGQNATLAAQSGDINLGSITATAGDASLTAGNSINAASGTVTAGDNATLTAQNGDINLGAVTAGKDAALTAYDDINVGAAGSVTAGSTATLTTLANDINLLGTVTAPTAILTANRNISGGGTVTANNTQLAAETGAIGASGDDLNVQMNTLNGVTPQLTAAARNDINLNLTAIDPPGPPSGAGGADSEPTGGQPTLYADLVSILAGGNLNLNLNPGLASGATEDAWYEIPTGDVAVAGGAVTVNEAAPTGDYDAVTLDVDGLLASGFQTLNYTISPTGVWSTTVGVAGQTATGPVNFGTIANGVINLSDINAAQGGAISVTGNGQLGNARNLVAVNGAPSVTVNNEDPSLTLQVNDITLGFLQGGVQWARPKQGNGIRFVEGGFGSSEFGKNPGGKDDNGIGDDEHDNGNEAHGPDGGVDQNDPDGQGDDGPTLTLDSAGGIVLAGHISNPDGTTTVSATDSISGSGLTESEMLDLASLSGGIGSASAPLAVGISDDGLLNASAAGDIAITAPTGDLPLDTIATPANIYLSTPAGSLEDAPIHEQEKGFGGDLDGTLLNNLSGANISLSAAGSIGGDRDPLIGAATGSWTLAAGDDLNLTSGADMKVAQLSAEDANLNVELAGGSLNIAQASIANSLDAKAGNISVAQLTHANPVNPLNLSLSGDDGNLAQSIHVTVNSAAPVLVSNYAAQTGSVSLTGNWLDVDNATIGQSASFQNSWLNVAFANTDRHGNPEDTTLDIVGNLLNFHADQDLPATVTQLQPGQTFTLPSTLTPAQEQMVDGLHLGHGQAAGGH